MYAVSLSWRRPIFPGSFPPSIFGTAELNFCVRDGNRWDLSVIYTSYGDPCGNRTRVTGVRGRCLDRLTNGPGTAFSGFARRGFADGRSKGCRPLDPAWYRLRRFWILKRYAFGMGRPSRASPDAASPTAVHGACQPHVPRLVSLPRPSLRLELYKVCLRHIPLLGLPRSCLAAGLVRHQGLEPGTR